MRVLILATSFARMYTFITPKMIRKAAETEVPIMPPTLEKASKREETAAAVAATAMEVAITMLWM